MPVRFQPPLEYVHDAWNRLVSITRQPGSVLRGSYEYNGLNWRTLRRYDSGATQATAVDDERIYYYSAAWQVLEEHVDEDFGTSAGTDRIVQQVWGVRYIDDAVLRRLDRNADGDGIGCTKAIKGVKIMVLVDARGMPVAVDTASAIPVKASSCKVCLISSSPG
ncbi:MAG: hypothetical protein KF757_06220 [Phycisphaeraceae bacterium]|nr:hypothetical protein [Phycisphaeraceae bacterium]